MKPTLGDTVLTKRDVSILLVKLCPVRVVAQILKALFKLFKAFYKTNLEDPRGEFSSHRLAGALCASFTLVCSDQFTNLECL